jgi:hypothetical protein
VGFAAWAALFVLTVTSARADHGSALSTWVAMTMWKQQQGILAIPAFAVLGGGAYAGFACGRLRHRYGRILALLGSVVAFLVAWAFLYFVLDARNCFYPKFAILGAVAVGMGGLAGLASDDADAPWRVIPAAVILTLPFGYIYTAVLGRGCSW